jgi:hypothetical protein
MEVKEEIKQEVEEEEEVLLDQVVEVVPCSGQAKIPPPPSSGDFPSAYDPLKPSNIAVLTY